MIFRDYLYICTSKPSHRMLELLYHRGWQAEQRPPRAQRLPRAGAKGLALAVVDFCFPTEVEEDWQDQEESTDEGPESVDEEDVPPWAESVLPQKPIRARLTGLPVTSSGFGKIGVSRSPGVRKRLHVLQGALTEALRSLAPTGLLAPQIVNSIK